MSSDGTEQQYAAGSRRNSSGGLVQRLCRGSLAVGVDICRAARFEFQRPVGGVHQQQEPALVKEAEIELIVSFCLPQTQRADIFSSVAYHGVVVWNCVHIAVSVVYHNGFLLPADAPGVAVLLPVIGGLSLEAVLYALLEQTILVTDTVAVQGEVQRSGAVKKACCEPAKAAVSEGCVLDLFKFGDISLPLKFSLSILLLLSDAALQT